MKIDEIYRISRSISLSFINKRRIKNIKVNEIDLEQNYYLIYPFTTTSRDNLYVHCLFVCYNFNPTSYSKMIELVKMYINTNKKDKFYVFRDNLKNNSKYFKEDIENINLRYTQITINEIFKLYHENKIRFYTLYELVKDYNLSTLQEIEFEKIKVLMEFLIFEFMYTQKFVIEGDKKEQIKTTKVLSDFF